MDCTAIILAGGQGVRLGRLGQYTNKALLVTYDRPLLVRHLDHLIEAGFWRIVVSTNPTHHPALEALVSGYRPAVVGDIRVVNNPAHLVGPIEALQVVVKMADTRRCLMVLADEYVITNGFHDFASRVDENADYTAIAPVIDPRELRRGGYVRCDASRIAEFVEKRESEAADGYPSPGTSLFSTQDTLDAIATFLKRTPAGASVGDFYNFRCQQGHRINALMGPDFVNINTPDYLLLATLYAAMEAHSANLALRDSFAKTAAQLREQIAATF